MHWACGSEVPCCLIAIFALRCDAKLALIVGSNCSWNTQVCIHFQSTCHRTSPAFARNVWEIWRIAPRFFTCILRQLRTLIMQKVGLLTLVGRCRVPFYFEWPPDRFGWTNKKFAYFKQEACLVTRSHNCWQHAAHKNRCFGPTRGLRKVPRLRTNSCGHRCWVTWCILLARVVPWEDFRYVDRCKMNAARLEPL